MYEKNRKMVSRPGSSYISVSAAAVVFLGDKHIMPHEERRTKHNTFGGKDRSVNRPGIAPISGWVLIENMSFPTPKDMEFVSEP